MGGRLVGNTHLIAGNAQLLPALFSLLEREGIRVAGNPDVYVREYESFGIDEARELRERASLRAIQRDVLGGRRVFILVSPNITREAQNALLKTLEEPPADALFFFITPAPSALLPTLRSRAQPLALPEQQDAGGILDAKQFLAASPRKRLLMLAPLLEKDEDEKRDRAAIIAFLSSLERILARETKRADSEGIASVYRAKTYILDKGALIKPLLEQVALLAPRV